MFFCSTAREIDYFALKTTRPHDTCRPKRVFMHERASSALSRPTRPGSPIAAVSVTKSAVAVVIQG